MTIQQIEIQLIAAVVAAACAVPGVFLILRKMAMMSDAISHAILPGIVVAFFLTGDLSSPLLIVGATLTGLLTVFMVEMVYRTGLVKEDAAIGLVFPVLFSIGVILISKFAGDIHLDTDAVLLGELAFAPFNRMVVAGVDIGPKSLAVMSGILVLNLVFVLAFYKELKLATFDSGLAAALGFLPGLMHYALMGLVSCTAVGAFDAVGSILVVAFMIGPPASAYLLTDRLAVMIGLSVGIGVVSSIVGYWIANVLDASIAGSMAMSVGLFFGVVSLLAPERGLIAIWRRRRRQRVGFAKKMLAIHLHHHEGQPNELRENNKRHLTEHLAWSADFAQTIVLASVEDGLIVDTDGLLRLTEDGRGLATQAIVES